MTRGSGETTRQMKDAPDRAIYVWCNRHTWYPQELVKVLGRDDITVVSPDHWFRQWQGTIRPVVFDHALDLSNLRRDEYDAYSDRSKETPRHRS